MGTRESTLTLTLTLGSISRQGLTPDQYRRRIRDLVIAAAYGGGISLRAIALGMDLSESLVRTVIARLEAEAGERESCAAAVPPSPHRGVQWSAFRHRKMRTHRTEG